MYPTNKVNLKVRCYKWWCICVFVVILRPEKFVKNEKIFRDGEVLYAWAYRHVWLYDLRIYVHDDDLKIDEDI